MTPQTSQVITKMESHENSDEEGTGSVPGHPDGPLFRQHTPTVNLPPFWNNNAAAWFALAESRFRMKRMYDEWDRYDCLVSSLSKDSLRLIMDLITTPLDDKSYLVIKGPAPLNPSADGLPAHRTAPGDGQPRRSVAH